MSEGSGAETEHAATLRLELKQWEKAFTRVHGCKPGRDNIRNDASIAAKYKRYQSLQRASTHSASLETPRKQDRSANVTALGERSVNRPTLTPRKTPSKQKDAAIHLPAFSPVQEVEPTPAFIRCALGPTPQKDGEVLGLFDLPLSGTPSKCDRTPMHDILVSVRDTPSKSAPDSSRSVALSRTPQSSGKRFYLDAFAGTPLKRKREDDSETPSSAKRGFATPSFLRRSYPLAYITEDGGECRPAPLPFQRRGLVRSLSTIIQGLKKQEQERMDDDWDILNEIEREGETQTKSMHSQKVLVQDSQADEMSLGPDRAALSSDEDVAPGDHGGVKKPWKKKGLKRQTRRVIMRPVLNKPKKADGSIAEDSELDVIVETQPADLVSMAEQKDDFSGDDVGLDEVDGQDERLAERSRQAKKGKEETKIKRKSVDEAAGPEKTKARRANPLAHANFRKLKIKNKNSKANGRGGTRFGRR